MIRNFVKKIPIVYFIICILLILLIFLFLLFSSHIMNPTISKKVVSATYSNDVSYQVSLLPNQFITDSFLGMNQSYIADMVDSIVVSFQQSADFYTSNSVAYNYTIYAKLSAVYHDESGNDAEVWSKIYPLKYVDMQETSSNHLILQEQISVPYFQYQNDLNTFKNTYHLQVSASLDIIMDVHYDSQNLKKDNQLKLTVPLDHSVFKVSTDYKKNDSIISKQEVSNMSISSSLVMFGLVLLGLVEFVVVLLFVVKLLQLYSITEYERIKHKIKKDYGSIIVDIDNAINFSEFTIFEIKSIGEMVDLEEELRIPILFYEKKKARISYFVIIKEHYMYRYTLRDNSQEII